jgi:hypothetical protein
MTTDDLTPAEACRERRNSWIAATAFVSGVAGVLVATLYLYRAADGTAFPSIIEPGIVETVCSIDVAALP